MAVMREHQTADSHIGTGIETCTEMQAVKNELCLGKIEMLGWREGKERMDAGEKVFEDGCGMLG